MHPASAGMLTARRGGLPETRDTTEELRAMIPFVARQCNDTSLPQLVDCRRSGREYRPRIRTGEAKCQSHHSDRIPGRIGFERRQLQGQEAGFMWRI